MVAIYQRHPLIAVLATIAAVLAGVIGLELALGTTSGKPTEAKPATASELKVVPPVVATPPEQAYPETVSRPLFIVTRRPAPEAPAQQSALVKGQFVLSGVTIHGDTRIALLREKSSGRTHRVEVGKVVNGITLASVEADRVVLALGGDREELVLTVQRPPPQMLPQAAVPAPAPQSGPAPMAAPQLPPVAMPISGAGPALPPGFNPAPSAPPGQPVAPLSSTTILTPEEVLARRRARRVQGTP